MIELIFLGDVFARSIWFLKLSGGKADLEKSEAHLFYIIEKQNSSGRI